MEEGMERVQGRAEEIGNRAQKERNALRTIIAKTARKVGELRRET